MHSHAEPTKWVSAPPSTMARWLSTVANLLMNWMLALTTQVLTWRLVCIISRHVCTLSSAELSKRRFAEGYCRGRVGFGGALMTSELDFAGLGWERESRLFLPTATLPELGQDCCLDSPLLEQGVHAWWRLAAECQCAVL